MPKELAQNIKIVPAGFKTRNHLATEPEGPSWVNGLWFSILHAAKTNAKPVIMRILMNRIFDTNLNLSDSYNGEMLTHFIPVIHSTYEQRAVKLEVIYDDEEKASVGLAWSSLCNVEKYESISYNNWNCMILYLLTGKHQLLS